MPIPPRSSSPSTSDYGSRGNEAVVGAFVLIVRYQLHGQDAAEGGYCNSCALIAITYADYCNKASENLPLARMGLIWYHVGVAVLPLREEFGEFVRLRGLARKRQAKGGGQLPHNTGEDSQ